MRKLGSILAIVFLCSCTREKPTEIIPEFDLEPASEKQAVFDQNSLGTNVKNYTFEGEDSLISVLNKGEY